MEPNVKVGAVRGGLCSGRIVAGKPGGQVFDGVVRGCAIGLKRASANDGRAAAASRQERKGTNNGRTEHKIQGGWPLHVGFDATPGRLELRARLPSQIIRIRSHFCYLEV